MLMIGAGLSGYLLLVVLWLQNVWQWSTITTGFAVAPGPAAVPLVTVIAQRLAQRTPAGRLALIGCVAFAAGTVLTLGRASDSGRSPRTRRSRTGCTSTS